MATFIKLGTLGEYRMVNLDHVVEVTQWDHYPDRNEEGVVLHLTDDRFLTLDKEESEQFLTHVSCLDATAGVAR